jgi:serine O-acetyltransferase
LILTREELDLFLRADEIAFDQQASRNVIERFDFYYQSELLRFQKLLRKTEYYYNKKSAGDKLHFAFLYDKLHKFQVKYGFSIPLNCFGPGLRIMHRGEIVVSKDSKIGSNCRIHHGVTIGTDGLSNASPVIGDNVCIYSGAKIYGNISIANGVIVGANSVVNRSILESNVTVAGVPARKIKDSGTSIFLVDALALARKQLLSTTIAKLK